MHSLAEQVVLVTLPLASSRFTTIRTVATILRADISMLSHFNVTGFLNTAIGAVALDSNTIGSYNTACGGSALGFNTTGCYSTATGAEALANNSTGSANTANGSSALYKNTSGIDNTANGYTALYKNTTGSYNSAYGEGAMYGNTTASNNTAVGQSALKSNTIGQSNIAVGSNAGIKLTTGSNNIDIFDRGVAGEANTIRIGSAGIQTSTFIAGISGATVAGGVGVVIDTNGHLGTVVSSERFKDTIKPMDKASEAILSLQPVTFHYKHELDPDGIAQFGLVAEQVEKVNPDLVARDEQGKAYTVRYEAVNAMLLNEFLKEHRKVEEQSSHITKQDNRVETLETTIAQQQSQIQALTEALKAQAAQIQKVSDQLRTQTPAPRVVAENW